MQPTLDHTCATSGRDGRREHELGNPLRAPSLLASHECARRRAARVPGVLPAHVPRALQRRRVGAAVALVRPHRQKRWPPRHAHCHPQGHQHCAEGHNVCGNVRGAAVRANSGPHIVAHECAAWATVALVRRSEAASQGGATPRTSPHCRGARWSVLPHESHRRLGGGAHCHATHTAPARFAPPESSSDCCHCCPSHRYRHPGAASRWRCA